MTNYKRTERQAAGTQPRAGMRMAAELGKPNPEPAKKEDVDALFIRNVRVCDLGLVRKMAAEDKIKKGTVEEAIRVATELGEKFRDEAVSHGARLTRDSGSEQIGRIEQCNEIADYYGMIVAMLKRHLATK